MRKNYIILLLMALIASGFHLTAANELPPSDAMEQTWQEFRQIHPYGFQTVALKYVGDECIFIISEPSESVTERALESLFITYGGMMTVKHQPLGYGGWLADVVGSIKFQNDEGFDEESFDNFTRDLFNLLYGTDYKFYYTDLNNPSEHIFFSEYRLNYSISAAELYKWFITDKEPFSTSLDKTQTISEILSTNQHESNQLYYSKDFSFVAWVFSADNFKPDDPSFAINARIFALDTDIIVGAFGNVNGNFAVIARGRLVPPTVLPPLRIETIKLLASTKDEHLAQSFERYHIFAEKDANDNDIAPIYLSDELWHTEYGNILNITDQMLKSWTENGIIKYYNFGHPLPIDWAFNNGVLHDLKVNELTYNWNTAGAGYVIEDLEGFDVFAVNRTGSLPVSFIPEGKEFDENIFEAEELAYDFFAELNCTELVREVQYATLYQIFRNFNLNNDDDSYALGRFSWTRKSKKDRETPPNYIYANVIEDLLRLASDTSSTRFHKAYEIGLERFSTKYKKACFKNSFIQLAKNDPYGGFEEYASKSFGESYFDYLMHEPSDEEIKNAFDNYLFPAIDTIRPLLVQIKSPNSEAYSVIANSFIQRDGYLSNVITENRYEAMGTLNWLLTDPEGFDSPNGAFYASKFTSHKQWMKSSPVTYSYGSFGYGGHNLDAGVTHVRLGAKSPGVGKSVSKGYCYATSRYGQTVLTVSPADKARITPSLLRSIERKSKGGGYGELFPLPKAPKERPKTAFIGEGHQKKFEKKVLIGEKEVTSYSELQNSIATRVVEDGVPPIKEITFKDYSAREVHVYADGLKDCILERMPEKSLNLKNFDVNEDIKVVKQQDGSFKIILEQLPESLPSEGTCKSASMDITVPNEVGSEIKETIIKVHSLPEEKINNRFKWRRELRLELQQNHPEINSYDILDEYHQIIGQLYYEYNDDNFITIAA